LDEWIERGIVQQGRGGYQMGTTAETLMRLLAVLLRVLGKPGVLSAVSSTPPEPKDG